MGRRWGPAAVVAAIVVVSAGFFHDRERERRGEDGTNGTPRGQAKGSAPLSLPRVATRGETDAHREADSDVVAAVSPAHRTAVPRGASTERSSPTADAEEPRDPRAAIRWRIVDPGDSARQSGFAVIDSELGWSQYGARALGNGEYRVHVHAEGAARFWARHAGLGRTEVVELEIVAGQEHDLGLLGLVGDRRIAGWLRRVDGHPVAGVRLSVVRADDADPHGLDRTWSTTDRDGAFSFEGLEDGRYHVHGFRSTRLELVGSAETLAGETERVFLLDGALVRARCVDATGTVVGMERLWWVVDGDLDRGGADRPRSDAVDVVLGVPRDASTEIVALATDGGYHRAVVDPGLPPGESRVDLRPDESSVGSISVSVHAPNASRGARLVHTEFRAEGSSPGASVPALSSEWGTETGGLGVRIRGVRPGTYRVGVQLIDGGGWEYLDGDRRVDVGAGADTRVELATRVGGRVHATIQGGRVRDRRSHRRVEVRRLGESTWSALQVLERDDGRWCPARWSDSSGQGASVVLAPGAYELRAIDGTTRGPVHEVQVVARSVTSVALSPEPASR